MPHDPRIPFRSFLAAEQKGLRPLPPFLRQRHAGRRRIEAVLLLVLGGPLLHDEAGRAQALDGRQEIGDRRAVARRLDRRRQLPAVGRLLKLNLLVLVLQREAVHLPGIESQNRFVPQVLQAFLRDVPQRAADHRDLLAAGEERVDRPADRIGVAQPDGLGRLAGEALERHPHRGRVEAEAFAIGHLAQASFDVPRLQRREHPFDRFLVGGALERCRDGPVVAVVLQADFGLLVADHDRLEVGAIDEERLVLRFLGLVPRVGPLEFVQVDPAPETCQEDNRDDRAGTKLHAGQSRLRRYQMATPMRAMVIGATATMDQK